MRLSEITMQRITKILYYVNLFCLTSALVAHILSFFGVGIFPTDYWVMLTLVAVCLYLIAASHIRVAIRKHRKENPNIEISFVTLADYQRYSHITMPYGPSWLIKVVMPAFWLLFPYAFIQIYLLVMNSSVDPISSKVVEARLITLGIIWLCMFSLPILYSQSKKMTIEN
jgi:hypothetical protein